MNSLESDARYRHIPDGYGSSSCAQGPSSDALGAGVYAAHAGYKCNIRESEHKNSICRLPEPSARHSNAVTRISSNHITEHTFKFHERIDNRSVSVYNVDVTRELTSG